MKISNKLYDILKWVVIIVLPAMATLYKALSAVWAWPYANEVVTTITAAAESMNGMVSASTSAMRMPIRRCACHCHTASHNTVKMVYATTMTYMP